ncbi:MAG: ribosome maturation factor RimM [Candidatus Humimicrobiaceae bacterium]
MSSRLIGVIGKPHGIKGEVFIRLLTDCPETISKGCKLYLNKECNKPVKVESLKSKKTKKSEFNLIKFKNIDDRNAAEDLRGKKIYRKEEDTPELGVDHYWQDDLIGCLVHTSGGQYIGRVIDVLENIANNVIVVRVEGKKAEKTIRQEQMLVPFVRDYIGKVDIENSKIQIKKIPEYI